MRRLALALALTSALAISSLPAPARAAGGIGQFVLRCLYSHTLPDDPIVFPGEPGASHLHDFFGNTSVDAFSTLGSMLAAGTTCRVPSDTAGYWAPTAFVNGVRVTPTVMRIYYLGTSGRTVETIPPGLQMVAGNREATSPEENPHVAWYCGATKDVKTPRMGEPYDCTPWSSHKFVDGIIAIIDFPNCWNGTGLRPEDVVYPVNGVCPSGFGHVLPIISERVHYGLMNPMNPDGTQGLRLSSGPAYTLHADFWNTWQQDRLDQLVSECIVARVHCGSVDATSRVEWTRQFGTAGYDQAEAAAPDGKGGSYVVGVTDAALPDQDHRGGSDAFIRRYDAAGNELWTTQFGTRGTDRPLAIALSSDGVFVAGSTDGRFPKQEAKGGLDAWIARFDPDGTRTWLRQFGTALEDRAAALSSEGGAVFVAGATSGRLFRQRGSGGSDAFVARFDGGGDIGWARTIGGKGEDQASALAVRNGIVHVAGSTQGLRRPPGDLDAFVATLTTEGRMRWTRRLGGDGADDAATALVARARSMFVSGWTAGGLPEQTAAGGLDAFVARLGPNGNASWIRQFGTSGDDEAAGLVAVGKGVYVTGSTRGALPDGTHLGGTDAFARKLSPRFGTGMWTMQLGTGGEDGAFGIAGDRQGVVLVGATHGSLEGFTNAGDGDALLIRIAFT
jgi:hypothetical protein